MDEGLQIPLLNIPIAWSQYVPRLVNPLLPQNGFRGEMRSVFSGRRDYPNVISNNLNFKYYPKYYPYNMTLMILSQKQVGYA